MEMLQQTAIIDMQIVLDREHYWFYPIGQCKTRFFVREIKAIGIKEWGAFSFKAAPKEAVPTFHVRVIGFCEQWRQTRHFCKNFTWVAVVPACTKAVGDFLDDPPIRFRLAEFRKCFIQTLNAAFCIGESTVFFK